MARVNGGQKTLLPSHPAIGEAAGRIWHYLHSNGETSVIKLKSELQYSAGTLHLALGWLLREDKLEFSDDRGYLSVRLRP